MLEVFTSSTKLRIGNEKTGWVDSRRDTRSAYVIIIQLVSKSTCEYGSKCHKYIPQHNQRHREEEAQQEHRHQMIPRKQIK